MEPQTHEIIHLAAVSRAQDKETRGRRLLSGASKPNTKPNTALLGPAKSLEAAKAFVRGPPNGM